MKDRLETVYSLDDILEATYESLELPGVLEELARHAQTLPAKECILNTIPKVDLHQIESELDMVVQFVEFVRLEDSLGFLGLIDFFGLFQSLDLPTTVLEVEELLAIKDFADVCESVKRRLSRLDDRLFRLKSPGAALFDLGKLKSTINRVFDETGNIKPNASPELIRINDETRSVRNRIIKRLEQTVNDRDLSRVIQEDYVTLRNDRYVILLRPEFKALLDGIVHDSSRSGASVYVEPLGVVDLNNRVAALADEYRDEIRKIFQRLTQEVRSELDELKENYDILVRLDSFQARALYALATKSVLPELVSDGFRLLQARHPLLLSVSEADTVPMDIIQDEETKATIISGANMGGKTVALKMAGLFPLMTRCSMMIPAREGSKVNPFSRIMADIGDDQNIRGRVSSFSGHMSRIKGIFESVEKGNLVLLDELGGATDPEEGAALAMAIVDELIRIGARVVVTTHLTQLKSYALAKPELKNVSAEFHPETLKPTYRLLYDLPGESHAISTAERIGLPERVLTAARVYADKSAGGSSRLLAELKVKLDEAHNLNVELTRKKDQLDSQLHELSATRDSITQEYVREAREVVRSAEKQLSDLQKSLKAGTLKSPREIKDAVYFIKQDISERLNAPLEISSKVYERGDLVRIKSLRREGRIKTAPERGKLEIAVGKLTFRADPEDVELIQKATAEKNTSKKSVLGVEIPLASPKWEVNVIGMRAEEALPVIEKAIDDAMLGGLGSMRIIHGKGTGRFKTAVSEYLAKQSCIKAFHSGTSQEGGAGVTIIDLIPE